MFEKLKLHNLLFIHRERLILKKIKGSYLHFIRFKRNILEKYFYNFSGICVSSKNRGIGSTLTIRNVINLYPLEYIFNRYSPLISIYNKSLFFLKNKNERKSKLYFLRKKPAPYSRFKFNYIIK